MDVDDAKPAVSVETLPVFVKFEDTMGRYKPHFVKCERFTTIDLSGDISRGIFTATEMKKSPSQNTIKRNNRRFWYCECCDINYQSLTQHVKSLQHKMFALTDSNFAAVDAVIHDIRSDSCQTVL